jgi:hypothetical protein
MPAHSTEQHHGSGNHSGSGNATAEHESIGTKVKNLFTGHRRPSKEDDHSTSTTGGQGQGQGQGDKIVDQTGGGEQLPSAAANAIGADNLNSNAETGWPGFVNGDKLGAVLVSLASIDHANVKLHQHKKEGSSVTVPVSSSVLCTTFGGSRADEN